MNREWRRIVAERQTSAAAMQKIAGHMLVFLISAAVVLQVLL